MQQRIPFTAAPWFIPLAIAVVLFAGSFVNNQVNGGNYIDTYLTAIWLSFVLIFYGVSVIRQSRRNRRRKFSNGVSHTILMSIEPSILVRAIAIGIQLATLYHYSVAGIPLFSIDPDVARMEFMQSTVTFKILKVYTPFFTIYYLSWILLSPKRRYFDWLLLGLMIFQYGVSGGKGAVIWIIVYIVLAIRISGKRLSGRLVFAGGGVGIVATLGLFQVVSGRSDLGETLSFLYDRLTSIAEYGLFVATQQLGRDFSNMAPLHFLFNIIDKYVNNAYEGYTPSLGREVTAYFYGGDVYAYIWELTVTFLGDFFILGGTVFVVVGCFFYLLLMNFLWKKMNKSISLYKKSLYATFWFHTVLYTLTGSLVAEFFVRTIPLLVFWYVGYLLLRYLKPLAIKSRPEPLVNSHRIQSNENFN